MITKSEFLARVKAEVLSTLSGRKLYMLWLIKVLITILFFLFLLWFLFHALKLDFSETEVKNLGVAILFGWFLAFSPFDSLSN